MNSLQKAGGDSQKNLKISMKKLKPKPLAVKENPSLLDKEIRELNPRQKKQRMYGYGKRLVKAGYAVNHTEKWFQTGYSALNEIPVPARYYARQMLRLGYYHQLKLI